jgi:hypothetical protein
MTLEFPRHGLPCRPIERVELESDAARLAVIQSRPFVARVRDWRALAWDVPSLQQRVGNKPLTLLSAADRRPMQVTLGEFLDMVKAPRAKRTFIYPNTPVIRLWNIGTGPDPELGKLMDDFTLPSFIPRDRMSSINLWASDASEGPLNNASHCEPNAMSNLNLQVRGKKHVWLFSPDDARHVGVVPTMMGPPFVAHQQGISELSEEHPEFRDATCYETILEPGDAVFIPTFWFHWFVHYPTYQLNLNFWWEPEQIQLTPISANWTFMSALCKALGGFPNAEAAFDKLPPETQHLLRDVEQCLLYDGTLTSPKQMLAARMRVTMPGVPDESGKYTARDDEGGLWRADGADKPSPDKKQTP